MAYKLAIYDWNGTLPNDVEVAYGGAVLVFKQFAPNIVPPSLEQYRGEDFPQFYYGHGIPKSVTLEDLYKIWVPHYEKHFNEIKLHDGVIDLLSFCKTNGVPNAIVSAAPEIARKHLKQLGIERFFNNTIFNATDKENALVETLDFFGAKAEDTFYVNDTRWGLVSAKNIGVCAIGFTGGFNDRAQISLAEPDYIVDSLREIPALIK